MKVVPEDVSTAPLEGASREPQLTTVTDNQFYSTNFNIIILRDHVS